jgi:hypothetical protein
MSTSTKAYKIEDIPQATRFNEPLKPFHLDKKNVMHKRFKLLVGNLIFFEFI